VLHGRAGELAAVNRLLERAREGYSGAVVVRGEAGIGKSALLEYAAAQASGFTVLRATGIESEAEFAFATLHQLLRPAQDGIDQLPPPQASGLRAAFGLAPLSADGDQRFLVAVAALTLLTDTAEQQPVLCLIDDAHWADRSSTDVLLFVARRLAAEGVVLIFAARDGTPKTFGDFQSPGVAELTLGGLDVEAAACLTPDAIIPSVLAEVVTRTGGNPLVLREVLPQLDSDQRAGRAPLPATLPIGKRMEQAFLGRVRPLPATTQELLEIIAADETGDLPTALRVASFLTGSGDAAALALAEDAGLIRIQAGRVEFRHPLLRTAVYRGMPAQRRRTIHWALADVLGDTAPDRRSWHLATASDAPDEAVAAALEDSAERARARSGYAAAATALERAADLSPGDAARVRRLAAAADNAWLAGQGPRAQALVRRAAPLAQEASQRAALGYLDGMFQLRTGVAADAVDTLLKAADLAAVHDPSLALRMLMAASDAANYAGEPARLVDLARRAAALPAPRDDRGWFAVHFLTGLSCVFEGDLDRGTELLEAADTLADSFDEPAYLLWAASTGLYTGRGDSRRLVPRAVARARALGAVGTLPHALEFASLGSAMAGYVTQAITQASEGLQLARDIGQEAPACNLLAALATATALQGREQDCKTYADEALVEAVPRRLGLSIGLATRALGLLDLGLGRPAEALERFESIWSAEPGGGHPFVAITSAQDLVESAVRAGRPDIAAAAVSVMAARSQRAGPAQRGMLAYSQGLVAEAAEAAPHFEEALWLFPPQPMPFWRARIQLGYGEQLRRARHRSEARGHLRAALETFERLGAEPWAERARAELRATGETARRRDVVAVHELTPQELQIAGYASQGASNPEIAAQLFLSRRTVEYHLSKVFQKLGVSSRTELAALEQR
jgi:DNA-binding CsgD family transcriptional regulator